MSGAEGETGVSLLTVRLGDSGSRYERKWEREVGVQARRLVGGLHMDNASSSTSPHSCVRKKDWVAGAELCCCVESSPDELLPGVGSSGWGGVFTMGRKQPTQELGYSRFKRPHLAH